MSSFDNNSICYMLQGVTFDTGGVDVKTGGAMIGMHRDKGGASAVAGFFQVQSCVLRERSERVGDKAG